MPQLAIGFCLGGMAVLETAREGHALRAVVSFQGLLEIALPAAVPISPSPIHMVPTALQIQPMMRAQTTTAGAP